MIGRREIFVQCKCFYIKHILHFFTFYNKDIKRWNKEDEKVIYLEFFLNIYYTIWFPDMFDKYFWENFIPDDRDFWDEWIKRGIYKRIAIGLNYIFGKKEEKDGIFDCVLIDPDYNDDLIKFLDIIIEDKKIKNDKKKILEIFSDEYVCQFVYQDEFCSDCVEEQTIMTKIQFRSEKNIFKRIYKGVKYICRITKETDCFEIDIESALILKSMLKRVNKDLGIHD